MFQRVVICGVGLIGGSFALALRKAGLVKQLVGMGRTRAPLETALAQGVIDVIATDWADALAGADLVLLGMPVGQMLPVMQAMQPHLPATTLVTDAGSTKGGVVAAARATSPCATCVVCAHTAVTDNTDKATTTAALRAAWR